MKIDRIFENAHFRTLDPDRPFASRVGVMHGYVVAVDSDLDGIEARDHVDLQGAYVVPGFNDVHVHASWLGRTLSELDMTDLSGDLDQVYRRIAGYVDVSASQTDDDWILCLGFDHHRFGKAYPQIEKLDAIAKGRPLFMRHTSGHSSIVNTAALRRIGAFSADFRDPEGGHVVRDGEGNPTGLVQENAQNLIQDLFKPYSLQILGEALSRAGERLASRGITSICDAGIGEGWIGDSPIELQAYQNLHDRHRMRVRTQVMPTLYTLHKIDANSEDHVAVGLDLGMRSGFGDDWLSIGPVKVFADGSLSGETAAMSVPYRNSEGNVGSLEHDPQLLHKWITEALESGWGVATHAIGDRGIDVALDAYEEALGLGIKPPLPLRIEHAGVMRPDQLIRIAKLHVVPTTQSVFYDNQGDGMIQSLEPEPLSYTYRAGSILNASVILPGSSDAPCASESALLGIEKFVTRTTGTGKPFGPAAERLSIDEALHCYTVGSALATGYGDSKGKIRPGYFADFTCLGEDLFHALPEEISSINVNATVVGGEFTYTR
ncbi:MAG: amidohydrolase [Bifidobacterium subtile]|jgi:predicted amidohydrolase YtcJ|nr:amidohydrolase [Bifidobacterium subtile]MCI1257808.1 amidohydrolase [Bifidobacterium subtile]